MNVRESRAAGSLIRVGASIGLAGYILSGAAGTLLVNQLHPQPDWVSAEVFAANYHPIQSLPFLLGFLLLGGMLLLAVGHYLNADGPVKAYALLSMLLTTVFITLIAFNYIVQTTFLRSLALHYSADNDAAIRMFSMSNPRSLSWAIEMWGYGILGVATAFLYPYYKSQSRLTALLLLMNCIMSMVGVVAVIIDVDWVFTSSGLISYAAWNLLMIVLMILFYKEAKKTGADQRPSLN